jgi:hypothetical protein
MVSDDPRKPARVVAYHKRDAARTQLETAVVLWFRYADPMAIHTLAAAANELYHGIGRTKGVPGIVQTWKKDNPKQREMVNLAQNFGKHANTDPEGTLRLQPYHAELLIRDGVIAHAKLFGAMTPIMRCFYARFAFENPDILDHIIKPGSRQYFRDAIEIHDLGVSSRTEFLAEVLPKVGDDWGPFLHGTPPQFGAAP